MKGEPTSDIPAKAEERKPHPRAISSPRDSDTAPPLFFVMLLGAMAGGMGWGIRGQYGHETGAMIAGVLVGLVLAFFFCRQTSSLIAARAVALMAVAIGFGGSMTYGQTLGLTQDRELIGNTEALLWGFIGLFLKGGIWIALAGLFFGIGLSRVPYRPAETISLLLLMLFLLFFGVLLINRPFDPANKILPAVFFSDSWYWEPDAALSPRQECWGGLLLTLAGVLVFVSIKRDKLAQLLACFGFLAGGFGFVLGQSVQAYRAWNPEMFQTGFFAEGSAALVLQHVNWHNMMETVFGAVFGAVLGLGVWLNRDLISLETGERGEMSAGQEWLLLLVHLAALIVWEFFDYPAFDPFAGHAIPMGLLPIFGIVAGRLWPYLLALPVVTVPIAGKTVRQLVYETPQIDEWLGWILYGVLPVAVSLAVALVLCFAGGRGQTGRNFARWALLCSAWVFFCLNLAFFEFAWPWAPFEEWTGRTPNTALFSLALIGITLTMLFYGRQTPTPPADAPPQTRQTASGKTEFEAGQAPRHSH